MHCVSLQTIYTLWIVTVILCLFNRDEPREFIVTKLFTVRDTYYWTIFIFQSHLLNVQNIEYYWNVDTFPISGCQIFFCRINLWHHSVHCVRYHLISIVFFRVKKIILHKIVGLQPKDVGLFVCIICFRSLRTRDKDMHMIQNLSAEDCKFCIKLDFCLQKFFFYFLFGIKYFSIV